MPATHNQYDFLSIKDLLDAREAFHVHLMRKENVIGTAIGKYRRRKKNDDKPKTLDNTFVDSSSWPCILVFVKKWTTFSVAAKDDKANKFDNYIPSKVYLPDGREVPLCVIEAPSALQDNDEIVNEGDLTFPSDYIGGGYPLIIESQGIRRTASLGCIVSDGNKYYAITNKHVTGTPGTIVYTKVKGTLVPIGKSSDKALGHISFEKLYNGWSAPNTVVNADIGLIEIDNIKYWKTDVFNIGTLQSVFNLSTTNLSLNLIGKAVTAFGAASGLLNGEISALFYRYKSVGGLDYISDFLIGAKDHATGLATKHGDSGTIWVLANDDDDESKKNQPLAIQWGQHCFTDDGKTYNHPYALGTCLSNVLRELNIDLVSGWNSDADYTWGEVGHYTIANIAAKMITSTQLKKVFQQNLSLITFEDKTLITDSAIKNARKALDYTPLADVPDLIWKIVGGDFKRSLENPNHFADMDKPNSDGKTLLELCTGKGANMKYLTPDEWLQYYTDKAVKDSSKGILPFRVWQIFLEMVGYVKKGNLTGFVAASGVLAHYVGDACQPLHISYMFNGKPSPSGKKIGDGVHEAFEATMINRYNKEIFPAVEKLIKEAKYKKLVALGSGKEAAASVVDLMKQTFKTINPEVIVDAFAKDDKDFPDNFWKKSGKTIVPKLFASGAYSLASLWSSAWQLGKGDQTIKKITEVDPEDVRALYESPDFLPSVNIKAIAEHLDL
ncbi:hypothetical protein QEG73_05840 [Chitinophagaceae bacterium 26-R-25]|nr:hypothetical protein [Chitinophagaceae bacterium 26-R-25]